MKFCQKCGNRLKSTSQFCDNCGQAVMDINSVATKFCSNCGSKIPATSIYCTNCDFKLEEGSFNQEKTVSVQEAPFNESKCPDPITSFALLFHDTFNVSKRLGRADYWWARLTTMLIGSSLAICWITIFDQFTPYGDLPSNNFRVFTYIIIALSILFGIWGIIALITAGIRRLHDLGYSGALMLLILLPSIGDLAILILCMLPSKQVNNRYIE